MRVFPFKPECQTPIAIHADCIMALQFAAQFVKLPSCNIHVCRIFGHVKLAELPSQFLGMLRLYSRLAARLEKLFQSGVPERLNHALTITLLFTLVTKFRKSGGCAILPTFIREGWES